MNAIHDARGVTLIELMLAQLLGLFVIAGALAAFGPAIATFEQSSGVAMTQESGRIALSILADELTQAGYGGCGEGGQTLSVIDNDSPVLPRRLTAWAYQPFRIRGIDQDATSVVDRVLGSGWNGRRYRQDEFWFGDLLFIQSVHPGEFVLSAHDRVNQRLVLDGDLRNVIGPGQILGVADCLQRTLLQVDRSGATAYVVDAGQTSVGYHHQDTANCASVQTPAGLRVGLGGGQGAGCDSDEQRRHIVDYQFGTDSSVFMLANSLYYIAIQPGTDSPSLYRMAMAADGARLNTEVIAEGIENMRVRYGVDADRDGVPERFVSATGVAAQPGSWSAVVSVRIWLLATSLNDRGHTEYASSISFPDIDGAPAICRADTARPTSACPAPSRYGAHRQVLFREIMLRNEAT